jgi:hypothetical protein
MKTILAIFAIILALVAISTWLHPVVSAAIITGSALGAIIAGCIRIEKEERV